MSMSFRVIFKWVCISVKFSSFKLSFARGMDPFSDFGGFQGSI